MVQIIPRGRTSFDAAKELAGNIGEFGGKLYKNDQLQAEKQQQQQKRNQLSQSLGINSEGHDPKIQKAMIIEAMKQQGKQKLTQNKQDFVSNLFGNNQKKSFQDQIQQDPNLDQQESFDPSQITDEQIAQANTLDPTLARELRAAKESSLSQKRHEEDINFRKKTSKKKEMSESYKENQKYIDKTFDDYEDTERREAIFDRMDQLESSGELSGSGIINLLEQLGLKQEWLQNPANEEYTKLALDLLGGGTLQTDYGSRVLASEFQTSLMRIPNLNQTPEGRKQIKENLKVIMLPRKLKQERLQYYLDKSEKTGEPLPHNIRSKVLRDIKPQLEEAYDKFKQRNGRYKVKEGSLPEETDLEKYYYISEGNAEKAFKMMKEDGYDIEYNK